MRVCAPVICTRRSLLTGMRFSTKASTSPTRSDRHTPRRQAPHRQLQTHLALSRAIARWRTRRWDRSRHALLRMTTVPSSRWYSRSVLTAATTACVNVMYRSKCSVPIITDAAVARYMYTCTHTQPVRTRSTNHKQRQLACGRTPVISHLLRLASGSIRSCISNIVCCNHKQSIRNNLEVTRNWPGLLNLPTLARTAT